jgi:hypothetical protein
MGSTHPPLESLLTFSQSCLEGFEHSRLNLISNLRKEFRDLFEEFVQSEIDARLARWIFERRQASGVDSFSNQTARAQLVSPLLALRNLAHGAGDLVSPGNDALAPESPCEPTRGLHGGVPLELQLPFRRLPVSHDASAALRSLEHVARCKVGSIGDPSIELLNCPDPGSAQPCLSLPFPELDALRAPHNVAPPISTNSTRTDQREPYVARHASAESASARRRPSAWSRLNLLPRLRRRAPTFRERYSFVVGSGGRDPCPLPPVRVSLRQFPPRGTASFLRN